jgi:hypothetical protein
MVLEEESCSSFTEGTEGFECLFACWMLERETRDRDRDGLEISLDTLWVEYSL